MKVERTIYVLCLLIFIIACNIKEKFQNSSSRDDIELILMDSISVNTLKSFQIIEFNQSKKTYLGYSFFNNILIEFDEKGDIFHDMVLDTEGPESFGPYMLGIGYFNDSSYVVAGINGLFFYNFPNNLMDVLYYPFKGSINITTNLNAIVNNEFIAATPIIHSDEKNMNAGSDHFKTAKFFTSYSFRDNTFSASVNYEEGSIHLDKKEIYKYKSPLYDFDEESSILYVLYPYETKVWLYQWENNSFQFFDAINLYPENFKELKPLSVKTIDQNEAFENFVINPIYKSFFYNKGNFILEYTTGVDEEIAKKGSQFYQESGKEFNKTYLQVFNVESKQNREIKVHNKFLKLQYVLPDGDLIFSRNDALKNSEPEDKVFYKVKISSIQ